jgi:hypothetical protein
MPTYNNLPGTRITRLDGGLKVNSTDANPLVLLIGTATKGPGDDPFNARDLSSVRTVFGQDSNLYQGVVEARRAYGEGANIYVYRMGTTPAVLAISGTATPNIVKVIPRDRISTIGTAYKVSFNAVSGLLWVYNELGTLVYSNAPNNPVDLGEIEIRGELTTVTGGLSFGDPTAGSLTSSVTFASSVSSGTTFTNATAGPLYTNLKGVYEALQDAYRLLENFEADVVVPLDVYADSPNVAYFISGVTPWSNKNNPIVWGSGTLAWFKETAPTSGSQTGSYTYQWANDVALNDAGRSNWASSSARIAAGYLEVDFAYQLANFCYQQTKNQHTCIGVIGFDKPTSYTLGDIHQWIGQAPVKNAAGSITQDGWGLLGYPRTVGCTSQKLNVLCRDKNTGRVPGFFATASETPDDAALTDSGGFNIDIGSYISLIGEWPLHLNSLGGVVGYSQNAAAFYAGLIGRLDHKDAPTNTLCPGLRVPYLAGKARLDALTAAKIVMMTQRQDGAYIVDAPTAATSASDYQRLTTVRLVSLIENRIRAVGRKYIGKASNAVTKAGFASDIEEELQKLVVRGYLKRFEFSVTTNILQDILGQAHVKVILVVPNELRQIFATIALAVE